MSKAQALVNKVKRRAKSVVEAKKAQYKMDKREEVLQASPRAQATIRKPQRAMDASFGTDAVGQKPHLEYKLVATSLIRFDYGVLDFGLKLTLPATTGLISAIGLIEGDLVVIEGEGSQVEARMLQVVSMVANVLRLDDVATYAGTENNVAVRFVMSGVKRSYA